MAMNNQQLQADMAQQFEGILQDRAVCKRNIPDLPTELWVEVLSNLPPGYVQKMIGINRYLFERGMDEIYEEVRMIDHTNAGLKTFEQICYPDIAVRVRRLYIKPTFLPALNSEEGMAWDNQSPHGLEIHSFLELSLGGLTSCSQLQELTIVLHDQYIPESFSTFLLKLLEQVGSQLHTLKIEITCSCFLSVPRAFCKSLPNLSSLTFNLIDSRVHPRESEIREACRILAEIIMFAGEILRSLVVESFGCSLSYLFLKLQLPRLKSLEVRAQYGFNTLKWGTHLLSFFRNASSLQRLVVRQPPGLSLQALATDPLVRLFFIPFFALPLSNLQELVLELQYKIILPTLTRYIGTFAPHLRRLTLWGRAAHAILAYDGLLPLLNRLYECGGHLEYLQVTVKLLSVDLMELFYKTLLNLKTLNLCYDFLGSEDLDKDKEVFYDGFRRLECREWKLEELKLMHLHKVDFYSCRRGDPDILLISAVSQSLPYLRRVVKSWEEEL